MRIFAPLQLAAIISLPFSLQAESAYAASQNLSQNFNYISGGIQKSSYLHAMPSSAFSWNHDSSLTDQTAGMYLRGSWNIADNFFLESRGEATVKNDLAISHGLLGLGYFYPIHNSLTVYGLAGHSSSEIELDVLVFGFSGSKPTIKGSDSGLTAEVGARYQLMDRWTVEPAIRTADYDDGLYELRLGNNVMVSEHMSLEANLQYREFDEQEETSYQLGARYSF